LLRPTISGLLRRDFPFFGIAGIVAIGLVVGIVTHGDTPIWAGIGLTLFFAAGVVGSYRSARSSIATDGEELRAKCTLYPSLRCQVSDIKRLYLSNATVVFGMTRPWMLWADLSSGERRYVSDDVKRYEWLAVFRLAEMLSRKCEGTAMPYLALVACGARRPPTETGAVSKGGSWAVVQRLRREGATGKLILRGPAGERWIGLIRGRYLRLEDDYPRDLSPDMASVSDEAYEFKRSGLTEEEVLLVLGTLEEKWLGASPPQEVDVATASG
jgi:hypothetical protein